jgi:hypothetical protein
LEYGPIPPGRGSPVPDKSCQLNWSMQHHLSQPMTSNPKQPRKLIPAWKALIEVGFIVFLFYSNLLVGEFTRANGRGKSFAFAVEDIFSVANFIIAVISGLLGYVVFNYLREGL